MCVLRRVAFTPSKEFAEREKNLIALTVVVMSRYGCLSLSRSASPGRERRESIDRAAREERDIPATSADQREREREREGGRGRERSSLSLQRDAIAHDSDCLIGKKKTGVRAARLHPQSLSLSFSLSLSLSLFLSLSLIFHRSCQTLPNSCVRAHTILCCCADDGAQIPTIASFA